jgi:hypothetical protein
MGLLIANEHPSMYKKDIDLLELFFGTTYLDGSYLSCTTLKVFHGLFFDYDCHIVLILINIPKLIPTGLVNVYDVKFTVREQHGYPTINIIVYLSQSV